MDSRTRWFALYVLCLGSLMIVLDTTIVNVALPSIRSDLGFSQTSLAWVVNAYTLTFGGFLLLGGRLGDLYGHRNLFLGGITLFTLASAACGLAGSQGFLVAARAVQGLGGAVASAVSLSLMMTLFTTPADRAKAMGVFGFVASGGGSIGVLLAGALMLAVYAVVNGNQKGWTSGQTLGTLGGAVAVFAVFLAIEMWISSPLMPLRLFRLRNLSTASFVGMLWAAAMF